MKLNANPIFRTQRRLAHRSGVLAPVLIALLIGLSLLAALSYNLQLARVSRVESGQTFYAWLLVLQALSWVVGGFSKISRTLVEERREGLLESNRLTPLAPGDLIRGYWLGAWLREFYIAAALMPVGLVMVLLAGLPVTLWLGTQLLLISTALFFGILASLAGMALRRPLGGIAALAVLPVLVGTAGGGQHLSLTSFLFPLNATLRLFDSNAAAIAPQFFGWSVPALAYTWAVQLGFGFLLWRAAVRKFVDPFQPAFRRRDAMVVFGLMALLQHGLVWGSFGGSSDWRRDEPVFPMIHAGTILLGLFILGALTLKPERARIEGLRLGNIQMRWAILHSGPSLALALAFIAGLIISTHLLSKTPTDPWRFGIVAANLLNIYLSFAFLLETCRLTFRRRAIGFFALGLFVIYLLPFVLGLAFVSEVPVRFSFLAPGVTAFAGFDPDEAHILRWVTIAHTTIVAVLAYFWLTRWRQWLATVAPPRS